MIKAVIYLAPENKKPYGFKVINHGSGIVCAAVSMLVLNTVNSLEALTDAPLEYSYDARGGYMECITNASGGGAERALLLLESLVLGLKSVKEEYGCIKLTTKIRSYTERIAGQACNDNSRHIVFKR